jgi:sugar phosphate isomerase/epimerase
MKSLPKYLLLSLLIAFAAGRATADETGPRLGLQTWTCRNMNFEQTVDFAVQHHIKYVQFYSAQLDPAAPVAENQRKKALLAGKGIVAYTMGVMGTSMDAAANRKLFDLARLMGMKFIVVEPKNMAEWDGLEALVKEYDIRLAIHNHGHGSTYADPATVQKILAARDPRIGVCLDIGWITAAGFDAAKVFEDYHGRVFDMHLKDKKHEVADGKTTWVDTEEGRGEANFAGLFAAIKKSGWSGVMAIETDSKEFAQDPSALVDGAAKFFADSTK